MCNDSTPRETITCRDRWARGNFVQLPQRQGQARCGCISRVPCGLHHIATTVCADVRTVQPRLCLQIVRPPCCISFGARSQRSMRAVQQSSQLCCSLSHGNSRVNKGGHTRLMKAVGREDHRSRSGSADTVACATQHASLCSALQLSSLGHVGPPAELWHCGTLCRRVWSLERPTLGRGSGGETITDKVARETG